MTYLEALSAHLAGTATTLCHCWRLTRRDGVVLGFTDHDLALTVDGTAFEPGTGLSASEARTTLGFATDTVDVAGALSSDRIREPDIDAGLYDGARVETLLVNWRAPASFALIRTATIGKVTTRDGRFMAELMSARAALDRPGGRYLTRGCDAELGDARCGVALDHPDFATTGTVDAVRPGQRIAATLAAALDEGWLTHGLLTWTSGARDGLVDRVTDHREGPSGTELTLWPRVGPQPAEGDAFSVVAGCDKRFATCKAKFANAQNFRGFPHLPGNDAAYGYATDGAVFDGAPLVP